MMLLLQKVGFEPATHGVWGEEKPLGHVGAQDSRPSDWGTCFDEKCLLFVFYIMYCCLLGQGFPPKLANFWRLTAETNDSKKSNEYQFGDDCSKYKSGI